MVVDTSAVMAILHREAEAVEFVFLMEQDTTRLISALSVLEAGILVQSRKGDDGSAALDAFLHEAELEIRPFDAEQAILARRAYREFGKGRHPAALNFGDCAVYALAMASGEPLLFKGSDFSRTDIGAVHRPA
jgi:ribonuclease VapC